MKTAELIGRALDFAVAKAEGREHRVDDKYGVMVFRPSTTPGVVQWDRPSDLQYSTDWARGGPIMEREDIVPYKDPNWLGGSYGTPRYLASKDLHAEEGRYWSTLTGSDPAELAGDYTQSGDTYLIAAMRCYVASKLGADVELPEELK